MNHPCGLLLILCCLGCADDIVLPEPSAFPPCFVGHICELDLSDGVAIQPFLNTNRTTTTSLPPIGQGEFWLQGLESDPSFYSLSGLSVETPSGVEAIALFGFVPDDITPAPLVEFDDVANDGAVRQLQTTSAASLAIVSLRVNMLLGESIRRIRLTRVADPMPAVDAFWVQPNPWNPEESPLRLRFALYEEATVAVNLKANDGRQLLQLLPPALRQGQPGSGIGYGDDTWDGVLASGRIATNGVYHLDLVITPTATGATRTLRTSFTLVR